MPFLKMGVWQRKWILKMAESERNPKGKIVGRWEMHNPRYVAGYVRVSSGRQVKEGESLAEQRRLIEEYAKLNKFLLYKIYSDEGISGAAPDRASLDNLKWDANRSLFQKAIFCSLDRFGRSAQDLLNNYEYFEKRGIALVSLREKIDTSIPAGRFLRTVLGAVAELEREMLRERTTSGLVARMKKGLRPVGRLPYGFRWDKKRRTFKTILREKKAYHDAVDLYLNGGKSITEVAGILNERGYRTRQGERFTRSSLATIFKNRFYKGEWDIHFQGEIFSYHPTPMIDSDTWKKLQTRIKGKTIKWKRIEASKDPYLLRRLLKCECGSLLQCCRHNMRYYACRASKMSEKARLASNSKKNCSLPYVNAAEIETLILDDIWRCFLLSGKDIMCRRKNNVIGEEEDLERVLSNIKGRIAEKEAEMKKLADLLMTGSLDKSLFDEKKQEIEIEMDVLLNKVKILKRDIGLVGEPQENAELASNIEKGQDELWPAIRKSFEDMAEWQKKELISEALGGKKLQVRVLRKRDVVESDIGFSRDELNDPVYKEYRGKKIICWIAEGDWDLDCNVILKHLLQKNKNHFRLANYRVQTIQEPG
jgi:site-specific DNA recombinase